MERLCMTGTQYVKANPPAPVHAEYPTYCTLSLKCCLQRSLRKHA